MPKTKKKIPQFNSEQEEREFWLTNDSTEYLDWAKAQRASFPNLRPSTKTISLRLSESLLNQLKVTAHRQDIPYQSLIKILLGASVDTAIHRKKVK